MTACIRRLVLDLSMFGDTQTYTVKHYLGATQLFKVNKHIIRGVRKAVFWLTWAVKW